MARLLTSLGVPCGHESVFDWRGIRHAKKCLVGEEEPGLSFCSTAIFNGRMWTPEEDWIDVKNIRAESSYMAAPFLSEVDATVIHVVRNPIKVVNSFCNYIDYFEGDPCSYQHFIYNHLPQLKDIPEQYDRACLYYVLWNELIEGQKPDFFHRIEDDEMELMEKLGLKGQGFHNRRVNTFKKPCNKKFSISHIVDRDIKDRFVAKGEEYGYNMSSEFLMI